MKKNGLLLIFLLMYVSTFAQYNNYHPLVQEGKIWSVLDAEWHPSSDPSNPMGYYTYSTEYFTFQKDTIINDVEYKKLYKSKKENPIYPQDWYLFSFMREEDNKKVWQFKTNAFGEQWEKLLYDFSLEVGDTIPEEIIYCGSNCKIIIDDIATMTLHNGEVRKVFRFSRFGDVMPDYWIEGIGSNSELILPFGSDIIGGFYELLCFHENNELIFFNNNYQTCYKNSLEIIESHKNFNIYPNPAKDILYFENKDNLNIVCVSLVNIMGQIVKQYNPNDSQISVLGIPSGMYFIKFLTQKGEEVIQKLIIEK